MAKIIWIGNPFFCKQLGALGHELAFIHPEPGKTYGWGDLTSISGMKQPDMLVVSDMSLPPFVLGVESFPCFTVLYCVDTHIHSWMPLYAQAFDLCLVSLHDHIQQFLGKYLTDKQVLWSPPFLMNSPIAHESASLNDKEWDLLFVGTLNPDVNPERCTFMQQLKYALPSLHICTGNYTELYPKARLVLNHSISADLNFRVFEALGCGCCLVTPRIEQCQDALFTPGQDLFTFDQDDIPALVKLVEQLLAEPETRRRVAASGLEKVRAGHQAANRASALVQRVDELTCGSVSLVQNRLKLAADIHKNCLRLVYLHLAQNIGVEGLSAAYLQAAKDKPQSYYK